MKKIVIAAMTLIPTLAFATPGAYVEVQAGGNMVNMSGLSSDYDSVSASVTNLKGFAGTVGAGYLWGNNTVNYGVELDGTVYPNSTGSMTISDAGTEFAAANLKMTGYNLSLLGVAKYTFASGFNTFAKAGVAYVHQKITVTPTYVGPGVTATGATSNGSGFAPEVALGVGYNVTQHIEMDLTADAVLANTGSSINGTQANTFNPIENGSVMLGLTYHFA